MPDYTIHNEPQEKTILSFLDEIRFDDSDDSWGTKKAKFLAFVNGLENGKSMVIPNVAANDNFPLWKFKFAITITSVEYVISGGTNWVGQVQECNDLTGAGAVDTQASDSTVTGITVVTTFSNAVIAAGNCLRLKTTSVSGSVGYVAVKVNYDFN